MNNQQLTGLFLVLVTIIALAALVVFAAMELKKDPALMGILIAFFASAMNVLSALAGFMFGKNTEKGKK